MNLSEDKPQVSRPSKTDRIIALGIAALVLVLVYVRDPRYFTQPRFWAEEGMLHFSYSYSHTFFEALVHPVQGYLNFWPNLTTWFATLAPLEYAPLVTTMLALAVQMIPVGLILGSRSPSWAGWWRKSLGIAVVLFLPLTTEVWLNTINSYTYLCVVAFFLLLEEAPEPGARRWIYRVLLALSGLTGTLACFLTPFFIFSAWNEKSRERWLQSAILAVCSVLQVLLIFTYHGSADVSQRISFVGPTAFGPALWTQSAGLFALGFERVNQWGQSLIELQSAQPGLMQWVGRGLLVAAAAFYLLLPSNLSRRLRFIYLGSYIWVMLLSMTFSIISEKYQFMAPGLHQRIFFAPNVILAWMLIAGVSFPKGKGLKVNFKRVVGGLNVVLLALGLFWGIHAYGQRWIQASDWPDWRQQVQTWRANPDYKLLIQPAGWTVTLEKR